MLDWPIVLQYDVKEKCRLISRNFSGMKLFHPSVSLTNKELRAFVSVRLTNFVCLFLFCSRVVISRSYDNLCNAFH